MAGDYLSARPVLVTINYNSAGMVDELIGSVDSNLDIIVVDNYSTAEARAAITAVVAARRSRLVLSENVGFAGGLNRANLEVAGDRHLLLVNPDVTFRPGAIDRLLVEAGMLDIDLLSPSIVRAGSDDIWFRGGSISRIFEVTHDGYGRELVPGSGAISTEFISGCVVLFSPLARARLLPLDTDLFMYYEDVLMSRRAKALGLNIAISLDAIANHAEGSTSNLGRGGRSSLFYYYQSRNRLTVARRVGLVSGIAALLGTPFVLARTFYRILKAENEGRLRKSYAALKGASHGLVGKSGQLAI